jgi:hypothetical protein
MKSFGKMGRAALVVAIVTVAALGVAALLGWASGNFNVDRLGAGRAAVDESRTAVLAGADTLAVNAVDEDVRITETTGDQLTVRLHGSARGAGRALPTLSVERSGTGVVVTVTRDPVVVFSFGWQTLALYIGVPASWHGSLTAGTVSGGLQLADHAFAALVLSSTSGNVRAGAVKAGTVSIRTTSGEVSAGSLDGSRVEVSSVSGGLRIQEISGDAALRTTSGNVTATFAAVPSRLDANSTSGNVTLKLPSAAQFQLDAHSTSGDIHCRFPITVSASGRGGGNHQLAGAVGSGTGQVTVRTVSGDIRID